MIENAFSGSGWRYSWSFPPFCLVLYNVSRVDGKYGRRIIRNE